ncbi:c-type cytochrome [Pontibacter sp. MBLB2868]|uniref:c-type cytochrome n=1 Tax=Pontibacter sp. MBLB2868 TaxID=3451555 RepID=UPI003F755459
MKNLILLFAILMFLLLSCKDKVKPAVDLEVSQEGREFELSYNGKKLVEGELLDTNPFSTWKYFDEKGKLLVRKNFYNTAKGEKGKPDLLFFDNDRLVYFGGRFNKSSPGDSDWGKTLVDYYCSSCHDTWEEFVGPPWEGMVDLTEEDFSKRLTTSVHIDKEAQPNNKNAKGIGLIYQENEQFSFLTEKDIQQIFEYVKELPKPVP